MQNIDIDAMKNITVPEIDRSKLIDYKNIKIDVMRPKREKIISYIQQTKNPYFFRYGNTVIKNTYPKTDITM